MSNESYHQTFPTSCRRIITPVRLLNTEAKREVVVNAFWDTGSTQSFINEETIKFLRLPFTGYTQTMLGAAGKFSANTVVTVALPGDTHHATVVEMCSAPSFPDGCACIIGMDIISQGSLSLCYGKDGMEFTFQFSDRFVSIPKKENGNIF